VLCAIDEASGELTALNVVSLRGRRALLSEHRCFRQICICSELWRWDHCCAANWEGGKLGAATDVHRDSGHLGAAQATDAPAGSFAVSGHDTPHAHMIAPDPQGMSVLATDLGQDRIYTLSI